MLLYRAMAPQPFATQMVLMNGRIEIGPKVSEEELRNSLEQRIDAAPGA